MDNISLAHIVLAVIAITVGTLFTFLKYDEAHKTHIERLRDEVFDRMIEHEHSVRYWREKYEKVIANKYSSSYENPYIVLEAVEDINDLIPASRLKDYTIKLGDDGELIE